MQAPFAIALRASWLVLITYWLWSARNVKRSTRNEPALLRLSMYWLPLIVAVLLLGPGEWFGHGLLRERIVPDTTLTAAIGLAITVAGVVLACWSRHVLGRNWSSVVQLKQDHELIERGPYRYVRHPIYTGLLLAFAGNAIMVGDVRGVVAVVIVLASFWRKLRQEERWLGEYFGPVYQQYMQRTGALLPRLA